MGCIIISWLRKFTRLTDFSKHILIHCNIYHCIEFCFHKKNTFDIWNSSSRCVLIGFHLLYRSIINIQLFNDRKRLQHAVYTASRSKTLIVIIQFLLFSFLFTFFFMHCPMCRLTFYTAIWYTVTSVTTT